jgi:hypothetical protein
MGPLTRDEYNRYVQDVQAVLLETEVKGQTGREGNLSATFGYYWDGRWVTIGWESPAMTPECRRYINLDEYHRALGRAGQRFE